MDTSNIFISGRRCGKLFYNSVIKLWGRLWGEKKEFDGVYFKEKKDVFFYNKIYY